jgi:uncharacterized protein DUF1615
MLADAMCGPMSLARRCLAVAAFAGFVVLAGCAVPQVHAPERRPEDVRAEITRLLPPGAKDREGWADDIASAFDALDIDESPSNLCAALAVIGQESNFVADPAVPGLGRIARAEIDRRAGQHHVPQLVVAAALAVHSSNGKSYGDRIAAVRTERELSLVYEDLIARVPLGRQLFSDANPVHTGGPMQVSVSFAEDYARDHAYPYPVDVSIRREVFTRRGGVYFGVAHLLGYPAGFDRAEYDRMIYRFADYNAGFYASRNAAFQSALGIASGRKLALDGDLIAYDDGDKAGATELAVRSLSRELKLSDSEIRRALEKGEAAGFEDTEVYQRVFARAQKIAHRKLPRAVLPEIALKSPKITRKLTTGWFAQRVDQRYSECLARDGARGR